MRTFSRSSTFSFANALRAIRTHCKAPSPRTHRGRLYDAAGKLISQTRWQRTVKTEQLPTGAGGELRTEKEIVVSAQAGPIVLDVASGTTVNGQAGNRAWF